MQERTREYVKRCPMCGELFFTLNSRKIFCNDDCGKRFRRASFLLDEDSEYDYQVDDYLGDSIYISTQELHREPTDIDRVKLYRLLVDFNIEPDIPYFPSIKKMNDWKRKQISNIYSLT